MIERKTYVPFGLTADASIDYLLGIIEDARATTLQRVEGIGKTELHWQYAKGWNTIGALLSHMVSCEHFFRITYIQQRELTKAENKKWLPGLDMGEYIPQLINNKPISWYLRQLAVSQKMLVKELKGLSKEEFHKRIEDYNPKTGCNLAWVFYHVAEDEVHHRGQISILRKLYKARK
ncbi:MAG: DinB family protein [Bacteroidota bacterium]